MLDDLQSQGVLSWQWKYDNARSRAIYIISVEGGARRTYETKPAEELVLTLCADRGIVWEPVPHPGGRKQLEETLQRIEERQRDR